MKNSNDDKQFCFQTVRKLQFKMCLIELNFSNPRLHSYVCFVLLTVLDFLSARQFRFEYRKLCWVAGLNRMYLRWKKFHRKFLHHRRLYFVEFFPQKRDKFQEYFLLFCDLGNSLTIFFCFVFVCNVHSKQGSIICWIPFISIALAHCEVSLHQIKSVSVFLSACFTIINRNSYPKC